MSTRVSILAIAVMLIVTASSVSLGAEPPRALPPGQLPQDARLQPLKDLDGYFPFSPPATREAWATRAEWVRRQLLVTLGLWPMPAKTPLNAVVHGRVEQADYTVEKVYFESTPGFFVTGNLYRPKGGPGQRRPGILCPHGHWDNGRFYDAGLEEVRRQIVQGAERFEEGGRSPLQARCVQLARMGCVVFHYDMIGYADSVQITQALAHGFAKQRPEMNRPEGWGLFSPAAESNYQSVMGLQTWNSIRSLDFLLGLPDVDPARIGVTGASGGGTQTFILSAIDPRPTLAFPAVMVSTAMQGGCTCENASGLRVGTGNVEFAALFAPKPLGMTSADDWTREMSTKGFPELKQLYTLLGAADRVMLKRGEHFGHNYNYVSRAAMYAWVNRHFQLGLSEPIVEPDYRRLGRAELTVWDTQHPAPEGGPEFERKLLRWWTEEAQRQIQAAQQTPEEFRRLCGGGVDVVIGRSLATAGETEWAPEERVETSQGELTTGLLRNRTYGEELPLAWFKPKQGRRGVAVWVTPNGKADLFAAGGPAQTSAAVQTLLEAGWEVVGVDLLFQGEFLADGKPVTRTRRVKNPREAAAYTFGYNHALFAQRVHDVLTVLAQVRRQVSAPAEVGVIGLGGAGPWVAAACAQARGSVDCAVIDTGGFRFGKVDDLQAPDFLPGGAKYGDVPGLLALGAPARLWLAGEGPETAALIRRVQGDLTKPSGITTFTGEASRATPEALKWLLGARE